MPDRCENRISPSRSRGYYRRCQRSATGDDGLCNICRAAIKRGEERTRQESKRRQESLKSKSRAYAARQVSEAAARIVKRDHPDVYAEAEAKARAGDNGYRGGS